LRHSHQSAAFESPADWAGTGNHPGSRTPCAVSHELYCSSHFGRATFGPQLWSVCPRLPPRHSFERWSDAVSHFGGQNTEASPLPFQPNLSRSGSVSAATYWQGLTPRLPLSFSRSAFIGGYPDDVASGSFASSARRLPAPAALPKPHEHFTRMANRRLWSWSHRRDLKHYLLASHPL